MFRQCVRASKIAHKLLLQNSLKPQRNVILSVSQRRFTNADNKNDENVQNVENAQRSENEAPGVEASASEERVVPVEIDKRQKKYERKHIDGSGKQRKENSRVSTANLVDEMHAKNEGVQLNEQLSQAIRAQQVLQSDQNEASRFKYELKQQKDEYVKMLEKQEAQIKNETTRKVFALIDETEQIRQKENELLDQSITEKRHGSTHNKGGKSSDEIKFEMDMRRKDIFVQYANLKQPISFEQLPNLVARFGQLSEEKQRALFKSLKIGHTQELAKVELLRDEKNGNKFEKINEAMNRADQYQIMLKKIIPVYFKEEYETLQKLQSKKENIEQIFKTVEEKQIQKFEKLDYVKQSLNKLNQEHINPNSIKDQIATNLIGGSKNLNYSIFAEKQVIINEIKSVLQGIPESEISQTDRNIEKSNMKAQVDAEYDANQVKNLMTMVSKQENDFRAKLKKIGSKSLDRAKQINSNDVAQNQEIKVEEQGKIEIGRQDFLKQLRQYNVDPAWLQNQQTKHLEKLTKQHNEAEQATIDILSANQTALNELINSKLSNAELTHHFKSILNQYSVANGISQDDTFNAQIMSNIEAIANSERRNTADTLLKKVEVASKTTFDDFIDSNKRFAPANNIDGKAPEKYLTYSEYRFNQLQKLEEEEESLLDQMSIVKRDAWLNIYNDFLEQRNPFVPGIDQEVVGDNLPLVSAQAMSKVRSKEDFYELFRDWQIKELAPEMSANQELVLGNIEIDQDGNRVEVETDFHQVFREMNEHLQSIAASTQHIQENNVYAPEMDMQTDYREFRRQNLLETEAQLNEYVKGLELISEASIDNSEVFDAETQAAYQEAIKDIEQGKKDFKAEFGVDVHNMPTMLKLELDDSTCALDGDLVKLLSDSEDVDGSEEGNMETYERIIQKMDNKLIRQIENHLAGVPRISEEYGTDILYEKEKQLRAGQYMDIDGFEAFRDASYIENLTPANRQKELLFRLKQQEVATKMDLQKEEALINKALGIQSGESEAVLSDREQVMKDLADAEQRIRAKHAAEENGQQVSSDPITELLSKVDKENSLIERQRFLESIEYQGLGLQKPFDQYRTMNKFGASSINEDIQLQRLAASFEPFEMEEFVQSENTPQGRVVTSNPQTLAAKMNEATSSSQVIEAAASQSMSPQDQKLAQMYQPNNITREVYLRTKYQMFVNDNIQRNFAQKILFAQNNLDALKANQEALFTKANKIAKRFNSDVLPKKDFDFIQSESQLMVDEAFIIAKQLDKFDPNSKAIKNFNDELKMQVEQLRKVIGTNKQETVVNQINFVRNQMLKNGVQGDSTTQSLLFQKSIISSNLQEANSFLKIIQNDSKTKIDAGLLQTFFNESLKRDNFDGLAYLSNYVVAHQIDISSWDMNKFRSALDFYLNHSFDLNKILTFCKFYTTSLQSALNKHKISTNMNQEDKIDVFNDTFGRLEGLVDINALFGLLVRKIGNKTFIDPITKQDPMMGLIDFYSRPDVQVVCKLSSEGSTFVCNEDIAQYLTNHIQGSDSFINMSHTLLQLNQDTFANSIIHNLKNYQATHKKLPSSFSVENVLSFYIQAKNHPGKVSEKTAEFLLYLFKSLNMLPESIDLCENFHRVVKGYDSEEQGKLSDIRNYYMSDTLLSMENLGTHSHELIGKAVFQGKNSGAAYVASMTKAYLKDGSVDYALKFFESELAKRREARQNQQDHLIKLFDATFGIQKSQGVNFETFKQKYASLMMLRERTRSELQAINRIQDMLQKCEKDEIQNLFLLQIVMKEERELIQELAGTNDSNFNIAYSNYLELEGEKVEQFVKTFTKQRQMEIETKRITENLQIVKERRKAIEATVQSKNIERLLEVMTIMGDGKVEIMGKITDLNEGLKMVGLTEQEYQQYVSQKVDADYNKDVIKAMKLEHDMLGNTTEDVNKIVMQSFSKSLKSVTNQLLEINEAKKRSKTFGIQGEYFDQFDEFEDQSKIRGIENKFNNLLLFEDPDAPDEDYQAIQKYNRFLYGDGEINSSDSEVEDTPQQSDAEETIHDEEMIRKQVFDGAVESSFDALASVVEDRKQKSLEKALQMFNKIQDMHLKSRKELKLQRNTQTFSLGEIDLINDSQPQQNAIKLYPEDSKFLDGSIKVDQLTDIDGKINIDSAIGTELNQRRISQGFFVRDPQDINSTIEQMDYLLNDSNSPILKNFMDQLTRSQEIPTFEGFIDETNKGVDLLGKQINEAERMEKFIDQIDEILAGINTMNETISQKVDDLENQINYAKANAHKWQETKNNKMEALVKEKVTSLFNQFKESGIGSGNSQNADTVYPQTFTRDEKIKIMHQALSLELGGFQPFDVFNSFYCQDLIQFGMQHNIPESVRLGEKMLNENGESLSFEMAKSVKQWKLMNNVKYQEAMKRTGPINTSTVYKNNRKEGATSIFNMDDPYWQEFVEKNYRSQDYHKLPSAMAWDYKEHGILSEFIDFKLLEKKLDKFNQL